MATKYKVLEVVFDADTKTTKEHILAKSLSKGKANDLADSKNRKQDLAEGAVMRSYVAVPIG
jgi:hypothetical protein